jgi:hypothetical protein
MFHFKFGYFSSIVFPSDCGGWTCVLVFHTSTAVYNYKYTMHCLACKTLDEGKKARHPRKRTPTVCEGEASNVQHNLHGLRAHGLHVGPLGVAHNRLGKRGLRAVETHAWSFVIQSRGSKDMQK